MSTDLTASTNVIQSVQRLAHHLRCLLQAMAGEEPDEAHFHNMDPDYDNPASFLVDLQELESLVDALDDRGPGYLGSEGREDWAIERESEISRLERENEELRRLLEIDQGSMEAKGITVDLERMESSGRTFLSTRRQNSDFQQRGAYWDSPQQGGQQLQRPLDIQQRPPAPQARRPGIFGPGQQPPPRPPFHLPPGAGRGVSAALQSPSFEVSR